MIITGSIDNLPRYLKLPSSARYTLEMKENKLLFVDPLVVRRAQQVLFRSTESILDSQHCGKDTRPKKVAEIILEDRDLSDTTIS